MVTTKTTNVIYINSSNTGLKISYKVLLDMENVNLRLVFDNTKGFFLSTEFIPNWFVYYLH